jgi:hypothetical protein
MHSAVRASHTAQSEPGHHHFAMHRDSIHAASRVFPIWIPLIIVVLLWSPSRAAQVDFWFSGVIESVNITSNGLPASIVEDQPFTGYLYYDTSMIGSSNLNYYPQPVGNRANYYFKSTTAFKFVVQVGGHTFANSNNPSGYNIGYVGIDDQSYGHDAFDVDTESSTILLDGAEFLHYPEFAVLSLYLVDNTTNAYSSILIPTNPPSLAQFPGFGEIYIGGNYDDGHTTLFTASGIITNITAVPQVMLNVRQLSPTTVQVAWPLLASGFTLQSKTDLSPGQWQDVADPVVETSTDHTVTVTSTSGRQYFRLKK